MNDIPTYGSVLGASSARLSQLSRLEKSNIKVLLA